MRALQRQADRPWVLALAALLLPGITWGQPAASPQDARGGASSRAGHADRAVELYATAGCLACHGVGGGGSDSGVRIAGTALSLEQFIARVRTPAGTMPPQPTTRVSDEALTSIHAWLRSTSAADQRTANTTPPDGDVEAGAALYERTGCYSCHSNQAQGGAQGPRIGPDPMPLAAFIAYVRRPGGDMPPYTADVLSDQDLAHVHRWLAARPQPPRLLDVPLLAPGAGPR